MKKFAAYVVFGLLALTVVTQAIAQERYYEWHREFHPMWGGFLGIGMILVLVMVLLLWVLVIVGLVVGIRWLLRKGKVPEPDSALEILRQRFARGELNKEEFEEKKKDLSS